MEKIKSYFKDWTMFEKSWLLISSVTMVVLSLMWGDSMIALLSGLAGIISVVLCAKGKIENYAFGLFQAVTYAYICFQSHIYGEVMYNILMVPMIIIGIISWKKNMADGNGEVKARNLTAKGWVILIQLYFKTARWRICSYRCNFYNIERDRNHLNACKIFRAVGNVGYC